MHSRRSITLLSFGSVLGLCVIAACSSPAPSGFNDKNKGPKDIGSSGGTFGPGMDGTNPDGTPKAACVPDKANAEIPGDQCDNDDDGKVDNAAVCDTALANDGSGEDFAKTMGICESAATKGYGLVSAKFTRGFGRNDAPMAEQHGVLSKFGNVLKPREGKQLGVLSSGYAQEFDGAAA